MSTIIVYLFDMYVRVYLTIDRLISSSLGLRGDFLIGLHKQIE